MEQFSKIINTSGIDIKFTVNANAYFSDSDGGISIEIKLKSFEGTISSNSKSIIFIYEINNKTLILTFDEAKNIKKLVQKFEQDSIDKIHRRNSMNTEIKNLTLELSYN